MNDVLVVEWLISWSHLQKILKLFKQKKHKSFGYYFEVTDLGCNMYDKRLQRWLPQLVDRKNDGIMKTYGDYPGDTPAFHLRVYRAST